MILAIDQGTTGTTCIVFGEDGRERGRAYSEFGQHFPKPGWVEHDAAEIWEVTRKVRRRAQRRRRPGSDLAGIGITNQRETVVAWDPTSGEPVHHALVWQDRRTAARCDELREAGHEALIRERTGLVIDPYFSGTKIEWLVRNGNLPAGTVFGTIDSWLAFKLTGRHLVDYSNASRTMLFDIHKLRWDPELCDPPASIRDRCRNPFLLAGLRDHLGVRRRRSRRGNRRRSAGGPVRPGLPAPGRPRTPTGRAASSCSTRARRRRTPARACRRRSPGG